MRSSLSCFSNLALVVFSLSVALRALSASASAVRRASSSFSIFAAARRPPKMMPRRKPMPAAMIQMGQNLKKSQRKGDMCVMSVGGLWGGRSWSYLAVW